ncbi:C69 family dipeptidase [Pediococcus claussenii]|uniref:Dipeptidase n=1 Tax=Pediococcus claussenii (strain ATCC BAA-344 / DSM 14800 / JCM 18046 / KCTC 3811 / LMG 21948 / P06) TaxID=701521 RepID=G8PDG2_PEDCP|nr:C69 family dipeptidase [Pediococcus claussenii]AEV95297.1 peptidase C69 family protein [Pediococcus claussenii ATCC BAA-344]ANZ68832.1 peptidase U34 [Pediococcus claussenii]ANZ70648.1 peptidase U34 [Pediococcus claussenii]KRN19521.1 hypothetical protein IV79_GL001238 [Pediococcus claussenii]
MDNKYSACTSFLAGNRATADGSTIIARNEDSKPSWPKHFKVQSHESIEDNHFKSNENNFEMNLSSIRAKYTSTPEWTDEFGLFEEDGINEYGVAMSATESAYTNPRVLSFDPLETDSGIGEEAMITVVLPYVKTARDAVIYLGKIIEQHGTSETNGILFSDKDEVWYMETAGGHQWVAQRIPDDSYAIVSNQLSIQEIDFNDSNSFLFKDDIKEFVENNHLNPDPKSFNFRNIFGLNDLSDEYYNTPRVWEGQRILNPEIEQSPVSHDMPFIRKASKLIQLEDIKQILGSHYEGTPFDPAGSGSDEEKHRFRPISLPATQESHILQIRPDLPIDLGGIHWLCMGVAAESIYVPFFAGISETPAAYHNGKQNYSSDSAYWTFKLSSVLVGAHYSNFIKQLNDMRTSTNVIINSRLHSLQVDILNSQDEERQYKLNQAAKEISDIAIDAFKEFNSKIISASTALSPLYFEHNSNL